jgi:hypothetical protein
MQLSEVLSATGGEPRGRSVPEDQVVELLLMDGWAREVRDHRRAAAQVEAAAALERCVALGLPFEAGPAGRRFDPVEVFNVLQWAGLERDDPTWAARCLATARARAWEACGRDGGALPPPSPITLPPQRYAVTLARTFDLAGLTAGAPLRLRLPLAIEDATLTDLSVEIHGAGPLGADVRIAPGLVEARLRTPASRQATLGVSMAFTALANAGDPAAALTPEDRALYLRPGEGLIKVTPRVEALAGELAGEETEGLAVVRRFWDFLLDEMSCGSIHYHHLDPAAPLDTVLQWGWYDCRTGSALLAALCRARGVPARLVAGYLLHEMSPAPHTWLEAWIDGRGWTPFDLWAWDLSAGGRDRPWRDHFFGQVDHRLVTERPPRLFSGLGSPRLPPAWHMLVAPADPGAAITFQDVETGAPAHRDHLVVERLG